MLTARAEYRLRLRADNAETRLGALAAEAGCLQPTRIKHLERRNAARNAIRNMLETVYSAAAVATAGASIVRDGARRSGMEWLRFPE